MAVTAAPVVPAAAAVPTCADCLVIPALTPVRIELGVALGSKISKTGDLFPITLAEAIAIDGRIVVPAGASGMGEVIHAKKAGGSGAPGELVLAARYLDIGGRRLRLRSLHVAQNGKSKYNTVDTLNMAAAAGGPVLSIVGFMMKGGETLIDSGQVADAKTAESFALTPLGPAAVPQALPAAPMPSPAPEQQASPGGKTE